MRIKAHDNGRLESHEVVYSSSRSCFTARRQRVVEGKRRAKEVVRMTSGSLAITLTIAVPVLVALRVGVTVGIRMRLRVTRVRVDYGRRELRVFSACTAEASGGAEAGASTSLTAAGPQDERLAGRAQKRI